MLVTFNNHRPIEAMSGEVVLFAQSGKATSGLGWVGERILKRKSDKEGLIRENGALQSNNLHVNPSNGEKNSLFRGRRRTD